MRGRKDESESEDAGQWILRGSNGQTPPTTLALHHQCSRLKVGSLSLTHSPEPCPNQCPIHSGRWGPWGQLSPANLGVALGSLQIGHQPTLLPSQPCLEYGPEVAIPSSRKKHAPKSTSTRPPPREKMKLGTVSTCEEHG